MTLASGTQLGPYEIVERLGAGGMGEVYRARDPRLSREVAVKLISTDGATSPDRLRRFETEARAAAQLAHPNVVTVFDVGTHEGQPYLVLELLEGETLREALHGGVPPLRQAVTWSLEISRGLAAAHDRGIVHRDLKPENVFLTRDGRVKVLDFGLAKLKEPLVSDEADRESPTATKDTAPGVLLGTVGYMSPEQVKGQTPDARTDVFALGVLLYEMVSGRRAFSGETAPEVLAAILRDEPPALESLQHGVPAAVETVVRRCLAKRPADRFSSARAVEAALETALSTLEPGRISVSRAVETRGPYPGLSAFTEADAERFFGREAEAEALWEKLRRGRLLAVIGPSGAGKSSFVRAGLVPARPSGWGAIVATPGGAPMRALAQALVGELPSDPDTTRQLLGFDDPDVAFAMVKKWRETHLEAVLALDQLEELFTLCPPEVQERFAGLLGRLAREADVHVLLSMRDDFLMQCHEQEALVEVFEHLTPLGPLSEEGTRRALEEPAKREGFSFEDDALVAEMLESVEGARGALPLLAFAVARLWEKRDREKKLLTREAYEQIGGVAGALAQHAEQTLERIGTRREPIVRELFRNLVTAQWTRAVADRDQLLSVLPDPEVGAQVLDSLVDARLLTSYEVRDSTASSRGAPSGTGSLPSSRGAPSGTGSLSSSRGASSGTGDEGSAAPSQPTQRHRIEIVHESLLRAWPRLVRWQAQDEEGAVLRDQLKQAANLWEEKGRPDDLLWTGTSEREFELWHDRYPGRLTALEERYSQAMVSRTRKRKRVRRAAMVTLVVGLAVVAAAIGVSRQQAVEQARRAEAAQLLTLGETRLEDDPTEALAYATAGIELADSEAARELVLRALSEAPPALELPVNVTNAAQVPTFSPDGEWLAAAGFVGEALVWKANGQGPMQLGGHASNPNCGNEAHWTGLGSLVTGLACGQAEQLYVWSLPDGQRLQTIDLERPSFWQVGQEHVFTESEDADAPHRVRLHSWHLASGEGRALGRVDLEALGVTATVTTPVSAGERSGGVWDSGGHGWIYGRGSDILRKALPVDGQFPDRRLSRHRSEVRSLGAFRRATDGVYSRDDSGEVRLFDSSRAAVGDEGVVQVPADAPEDVRPGPSGRWVVGPVWKEGEARLWDPQTLPGSRPWRLRRSGTWFAPEYDVHPSGDWLVVSMHGGWADLTFWPLKRPAPIVVDGYVGIDRPVAFTADSQVLVTSWADGTLRLWTVPGQGPPEVRSLPRGDERTPVGRPTLALDPHDRFAFVVGHAGRAFVVPLDGEPARRLEGFSAQTMLGNPPAVSPSGRFVAAISFFGGEKTLRVWDLESGETRALAPPQPPPSSVEAGSRGETGFEGRLGSLAFLDDSTLLTGGDGGVRRWDLETGSHEVLVPAEWGVLLYAVVSNDKSTVITQGLAFNRDETWVREHHEALRPRLVDLEGGGSRALPDVGGHFWVKALDPTGKVMVTVGTLDGVLRVGRVSGSGPSHILAGHEGEAQYAAISPDGRWVATSGHDNTLRLWPMPDLDRPPLHSLPHDELLSKLKSLTNLRAVRTPETATGWTIELDPFPGWEDVPTW